MAETNFSDLEVEEGPFSRQSEEIDDDGEISITSGVVALVSNLCATAMAITLPDPTADTDDYKRLRIIDTVGAAHTLTPATPFGNGGANEAVATFSGVVGDSISLIAFGGYWYITGKHQVTVAAAA
jgi:hypothetical protein